MQPCFAQSNWPSINQTLKVVFYKCQILRCLYETCMKKYWSWSHFLFAK
jgi:hypothetical protein